MFPHRDSIFLIVPAYSLNATVCINLGKESNFINPVITRKASSYSVLSTSASSSRAALILDLIVKDTLISFAGCGDKKQRNMLFAIVFMETPLLFSKATQTTGEVTELGFLLETRCCVLW